MTFLGFSTIPAAVRDGYGRPVSGDDHRLRHVDTADRAPVSASASAAEGGRDGARLAIVDTPAVVRPRQRQSDNTHSSDCAALRGLHQHAGEFGEAILMF